MDEALLLGEMNLGDLKDGVVKFNRRQSEMPTSSVSSVFYEYKRLKKFIVVVEILLLLMTAMK